MIRFIQSEKLRRFIREDDWEDLGRSTIDLIEKAIDEGRYEEAKALARYMLPEGKGLHDLYCDWIWDIFTKTALEHGEEEVYKLCRSTQETWMMKRTWKGLLKMTVEERVHLNAEVMRTHRCGPNLDGRIEIIEDKLKKMKCNRIELTIDPENIASQILFEKSGYINISKEEGKCIMVNDNIAVKDYYNIDRHFMLYEKKL